MDKLKSMFLKILNVVLFSLLSLTDEHLGAFPNSSYSTTEKVQVVKLDTITKSFSNGNNDIILLKIDTQGFEKQVIQGAKKILPSILGLQVELSLTQLYKEEMIKKRCFTMK
jgi:FkbM family methyltransferase